MDRHEPDDIRTLALGRLALYLAVTVLLCGTVLQVWEVRMDAASPFISRPAGPLPPTPRLQNQPRLDLQEMRTTAVSRLDSYGWVDKRRGVVHIPIKQAMRLMVEEAR